MTWQIQTFTGGLRFKANECLPCVATFGFPRLLIDVFLQTDRNIDGAPQPDWQPHESLLARWLDGPVGWERGWEWGRGGGVVQLAASDTARCCRGPPQGRWSRLRQEIINHLRLAAQRPQGQVNGRDVRVGVGGWGGGVGHNTWWRWWAGRLVRARDGLSTHPRDVTLDGDRMCQHQWGWDKMEL